MKKKGEGIDHEELGNPQPQKCKCWSAERQNASDDFAGNFHHVVFDPIDDELIVLILVRKATNELSPIIRSRRIATS